MASSNIKSMSGKYEAASAYLNKSSAAVARLSTGSGYNDED